MIRWEKYHLDLHLLGAHGSVWSRDIMDTMSRDIVDSGVNYVNGYF